MITWLDKVFESEWKKLKSLLTIDEESKSSWLKRILHYTATFVFLAVSLTILIKGTLELKEFLLNDLFKDMPIVRGILGGLFKTSIFIAMILVGYLFIIRVLVWLKKRIQPYEIAGFLGLIALVTNLVKNLLANTNDDFWVFSAKFVAKTVGVGWDE